MSTTSNPAFGRHTSSTDGATESAALLPEIVASSSQLTLASISSNALPPLNPPHVIMHPDPNVIGAAMNVAPQPLHPVAPSSNLDPSASPSAAAASSSSSLTSTFSHTQLDSFSWLSKSSMQQSPTCVYYSRDPISNLQIRVLLRAQPDDHSTQTRKQPKTMKQLNLQMKEKKKEKERRQAKQARGEPLSSAATAAVSADEPPPAADYTPTVITSQLFSWQQKVCSPAEILLASLHKKSSLPYSDQVLHLLKAQYPYDTDYEQSARKYITEQRAGMMLHSKREHDRYIDPDALHKHVTTSHSSSSSTLNPLAERIIKAPLLQINQKNSSHLTRELDSIPYHILATIDLPNDPTRVHLLHANNDDSDSSSPPSIGGAFQKLLCSIKVSESDEYITLEMKPAFSPPQHDPTIFVEEEWYSFYTPAGEQYRYRIENLSGVIEESSSFSSAGATSAGGKNITLLPFTSHEIDTEILRLAEHDMLTQITRSGRTFDLGPLQGMETYHVLGEIIKTQGFDGYDNLACSYELDLRTSRQAWDALRGERAHSHAQQGRGGGMEDDPTQQQVWMTAPNEKLEGITQSSYGVFEPVESIVDTSPAATSASSSSSPSQSKPSTSTLYSTSTTTIRASYFNFPFDYKLTKSTSLISLPPLMYFTIHTRSYWGVSSVIGYGYVHVPLTSGVHELTIDTWMPLGSVRQQKTQFFIGAAPALRESRLVGVQNEKSVSNRYGWTAQHLGSVKVRFEVVHVRSAAAAQQTKQQTTNAKWGAAMDSLRMRHTHRQR